MLYSYEITITAATAEKDAVDTVAKLCHGVITKVSFRPRPGHCGLLRCRVLQHLHQLWPTNEDDSLHGDTFPIEWEENHEVTEAPYELTIRAWNLDETYAHTFDISFAVLPTEQTIGAILARALTDMLRMLSPKRIFGGGG